MAQSSRERPYHHGNLRSALIQEAVRALAEDGPTDLSLRDLARRVGVSHAAPARHFGDRTGLLTAVAAEGFLLLGEELRDAYERTGDIIEVGVAYVRFAIEQRPYFELMFRLDLHRTGDPELVEARNRAGEEVLRMFYGRFARGPLGASEDEVLSAGIAAWSLAHGLATLLLNGDVPGSLSKNPEAVARSVLRRLSRVSGPDELVS